MNKNQIIREMARQLIEFEADNAKRSNQQSNAIIIVTNKLRLYLTKLTGTLGVNALFSRALTISKTQVQTLRDIEVLPDGTLQGLENVSEDSDAATIIVAELLCLLITFIGISLTIHMLHDIWPEIRTESNELGKDINNEQTK
jgi:hypothetical protein